MNLLFPIEPRLRLSDLFQITSYRRIQLNDEWRLATAYSARYVLYQLLLGLRRSPQDEIILPGFHCISVVEAIKAAGYRILFYDVPFLNSLECGKILQLAGAKTRAIVIIHYFGFRQDTHELARACRQKGIVLVEDFAHMIPHEVHLLRCPKLVAGDIAVFSLKKMLPAFDGGFGLYRASLGNLSLRKKRPAPSETIRNLYHKLEQSMHYYPSATSNRRLAASPAKNDVAEPEAPARLPNSELNFIPANYQFMEQRKYWNMSSLSKLLWRSCNLSSIIEHRRRNYLSLVNMLQCFDEIHLPLPNLPEAVCPWALPFVAEGIPHCDFELRAQGIPAFTFGERLHPMLQRGGYEASFYWSEHLKLIPIHQDLQPSTLEAVPLAFRRLLLRNQIVNFNRQHTGLQV